MYLRVSHVVLERICSLDVTGIKAQLLSGNVPTTFVRRVASLISRSIGFLVLILKSMRRFLGLISPQDQQLAGA